MYDSTTAPLVYGNFTTFRDIIIKEEVDIVHSHQSTSVTGLEFIFHARTLGKHVVFTDHSLFAFNDLTCVNINKVVKCFLTDVDQTISVSYLGREDIILRALLNPRICNAIPNAIDFTQFKPNNNKPKQKDEIIIVSVSRQTYRKGTDLLIEVIPEICEKHSNVKFLIGGDGPKKVLLENMVICSKLEDKVTLLGAIPHNKVRDVMKQGHIYLNPSLTEAFCIAIVEAASTGLYVVTTDVGGVGEVLPEPMMYLAAPEKHAIIKGLEHAMSAYKGIEETTKYFHERLKSTYNWDKVASKTIQVYNEALKNEDKSIMNRIKKCIAIGRLTGVFFCIAVILNYLLLILFALISPKRSKSKEKNFNYEKYRFDLEKDKLN